MRALLCVYATTVYLVAAWLLPNDVEPAQFLASVFATLLWMTRRD